MHDKGTKRNANANELGRCCTPGRTLYVQTVTINSAQPDFDIEISNCSCSVMRGHYNSILVSNERRWTELCNNENYILWIIQFQWRNNCSFGFPFYWDALYSTILTYKGCWWAPVKMVPLLWQNGAKSNLFFLRVYLMLVSLENSFILL